jgi:hypothetical protein
LYTMIVDYLKVLSLDTANEGRSSSLRD